MQDSATVENPCSLETIDKDELIRILIEALPEIREQLGLEYIDLERATNIGAKRLTAFEEGRQKPRWSEYLSLVFVLWTNERGNAIVEEKGLFPEGLRRAFSVNRNEHGPRV